MKRFVPYLFALALVACGGGDTVTGPSPTTSRPVVTSNPGTPAEAPTAVAEPEEGGGPGPTSVNCQGTTCTFTTTGSHKVSAVCTAPLQHNDWGSWSGVVKTGDTVSLYDICDPTKIGINLCDGGEQKVQVDFTAGQGEHIGHAGLSGPPLKWEPNEQYCECEPGEWKDVEIIGEPFPGEQIECPFTDQDGCFECFEQWVEVKQTNGCEERTIKRITDGVIRNEVECQCEPNDVWTRGEEVDCAAIDEGLDPEKCYQCFVEFNECGRARVVADEIACPPGLCYYRVSCGEQDVAASNDRECTDQAQQNICEAAVGEGGDSGIWRNFGDANLLNHCQFNEPGYVNNDFQLNPGQSAEGCLNKNDD